MTRLSVNLNKIALLRNSRTIGIPIVLGAAELSVNAGAHGITVYPRPDQRHIRNSDVYELSDFLKRYPEVADKFFVCTLSVFRREVSRHAVSFI